MALTRWLSNMFAGELPTKALSMAFSVLRVLLSLLETAPTLAAAGASGTHTLLEVCAAPPVSAAVTLHARFRYSEVLESAGIMFAIRQTTSRILGYGHSS